MQTIADDMTISTLESLARTSGPLGAAIILLVLAMICVWRFAAKPFLGELQPISSNLKETAIANKDASVAAKEAAGASKEAAEAWRQTSRESAQLAARHQG